MSDNLRTGRNQASWFRGLSRIESMWSFFTRQAWYASIAVACFLWHAAAVAGPEDDLRNGVIAFDRGDIVSALENFRRAADAGYAPAQVRLAYVLDNSEQNEEAFKWYQKAADQNNAEGKYGLGEMYVGGELGPPDLDKGLRWIKEAADQGFHAAMRTMAIAYERGGLNLEVDHQKALEWITRAADSGDRWAMERLVEANRRGELGLPVSEDAAKQWESRLNATNETQKQVD